MADPAAVVLSADQRARFTVLTDRVIRMEEAKAPGVFEDHATLAILQRRLPVPTFTVHASATTLTISTDAVTLSYRLGQAFSSDTLIVKPNRAGAFQGWRYGDASPGNLLGTIRGLDLQGATPLNCTENKHILDNGAHMHAYA